MKQFSTRFHPEANINYRYSNAKDLIDDKDTLQKMIKHHMTNQRPRLKELQDYYKGENKIVTLHERRREEHTADNRAAHNFARYVSQFIQGYMMGVPLKTTYQDEGNEDIESILRDLNRVNDADEHNSDLVLDQSIFGRAYELLYRNSNDETRFINLSPLETFVIYDDTVDCRPIAAVRYLKLQFKETIDVYVYTDSTITQYTISDEDKLIYVDESNHYFNGIPIVEYQNNKYRQGDFENVLSLIDLYDAAQSDTANYMEDLNDAMLKIVGNLDISIEEAKAMRDSNILFLQTEADIDNRQGSADADYIYKQYDVAGTEAYKDRLFNNILLFTSIPNLLDDEGTTAQSGEALKMKLFALSQKRATKERLFKKALRDRYRLINNIMTRASEGSFDVNNINVTFTENLPSMIDKELEWFAKMGGRLSQKTMLDQLSFVENSDEELERIKVEKEENTRDPLEETFNKLISLEGNEEDEEDEK